MSDYSNPLYGNNPSITNKMLYGNDPSITNKILYGNDPSITNKMLYGNDSIDTPQTSPMIIAKKPEAKKTGFLESIISFFKK